MTLLAVLIIGRERVSRESAKHEAHFVKGTPGSGLLELQDNR